MNSGVVVNLTQGLKFLFEVISCGVLYASIAFDRPILGGVIEMHQHLSYNSYALNVQLLS